MKLLSGACLLLFRTSHAFNLKPPTALSALASSRTYSTTLGMAKPIAVIVEVEVQPNRMDEFLKTMETNAINSRKEPGCLQFDVLRAQDDPNKFFFYEVYKSSSDVDFHKTQAHYQAWTQFKESGGTVTSVSKKALGEFMAPTTDTE